MALEVIGVGLGRTGTLSLKFALEMLGFGHCCHMTEVLADARQRIPLWMSAAAGTPDWPAVFEGFRSTTDYPAATYWRELAAHYPDAKAVLSVRTPLDWAESMLATVLAPGILEAYRGTPIEAFMRATVVAPMGGDAFDRDGMARWYESRNAEVVESIAPARLLVFDARDGWDPLCRFLGVAVPSVPYPKLNTRAEIGAPRGGAPVVASDPVLRENLVRNYIERMRAASLAPNADDKHQTS